MDTELLVEQRIDDGQQLIDQLVRDEFEVRVAFWLKASEESLWHLYVASPNVDPDKLGTAFRTVYASLSKVPDSSVSAPDIKLINGTNPVARAAAEVRDRYPGRSPIRYHGRRLGNISIEEAYIYPPAGKWFKGFDEIKRNFPSAEVFTIPVPFQNLAPATFGGLVGCINAMEFERRPAGTVMFFGPKGSSGQPLAELYFVSRPEGWNAVYKADPVNVSGYVPAGQPIYRSVDFSPLAALKTEMKPQDNHIEQIKALMAQGYRITLPPDDTEISTIPFIPAGKPGEPLPSPIDWEWLRSYLADGGRINLYRPTQK